MADNREKQLGIGEVQQREIVEEMRGSYIDYAMSVIVARALPDVRDGLKPVHRRILFAMQEDGLTHGAKYRKCATVVGSTLGRYHPHGDVAVYDSLVRMAQDFSMRYPLIDGQGNFGCFTKDTKVRLTDGRTLSFGELVKEHQAGKRNWTFSFNHQDQKIEVAEIKNPRLTRKDAELVEVELDNKEKIRCTPDHRFMLRDGSYREAKDLREGEALKSLQIKNLAFEGEEFDESRSNPIPWSGISSIADQDALSSPLGEEFQKAVEARGVAPRRLSLTKEITNYSAPTANLLYPTNAHGFKVKSVKFLEERADVYDITVDSWHNFALAAGIFVHNSIDGDPAAAMRYSEARMARIGEFLLQDIAKNTVDFMDNYDGTRKEPTVLPSPVPQLLLNGTLGIAVGMATNVPPHNIREVLDATVYLIDNPKATTEDLFQFVKGPDFPTGGIIYNKKEILEAYSQGKGPIATRGKAEVVDGGEKKRTQIVITEIPYQVNKSSLVEQFAKLVQDKKIDAVKDIRDESDKDGMRIVFDLQRDAQPQKILNRLYKFSDLQKSFHLNMIALVDGLQPKVLSLAEILQYFVDHRRVVVHRRTQYDLDRAKEREHILEGLHKCLANIDEVIRIIRKAADRPEAQKNLMKRFRLTEIQANAILDTRLAQLARLERQKIEDELKEIRAKITELSAILASPRRIDAVIKKELADAQQIFGDERRTKVVAQGIGEIAEEDLIPQEEAIITLTQGGYIKRINPATYKIQKRGGKGIMGMKTVSDDIIEHFISAQTHDSLMLFTDSGKVFQTPVYEIPEGTRVSKGRGLLNFLEMSQDDKVLSLFALGKEDIEAGVKYLLMVTKQGIVKKTPLEDFKNVRRSGLIAISLKKGDALWAVRKSTGQDEVIITTKKGQAVRFKEKDVRPMGRTAAGIHGIRLKKGDEVIGMDVIAKNLKPQANYVLVVTENGYGKRTDIKEYRLQSRGGSGIKTANVTAKTGELVYSCVLVDEEEDLIVISRKGTVIRTAINTIPKISRSTQGVRIMKLEEGDKVASAACV